MKERGMSGVMKGLFVAIGCIVGYWVITYLSGYELLAGYGAYLPALIIGAVGLWMVWNKIDYDTPFGMGFLAASAIILGVQYGVL